MARLRFTDRLLFYIHQSGSVNHLMGLGIWTGTMGNFQPEFDSVDDPGQITRI